VQKLRKRLSYANVMSTLAVFLVIGGATAIAAKVPRHSVGPRQLKANAVTTTKIKANAVTTRKLKKNAVTTIKLRDNAVTNEKLDDDSVTTAKIAKEAVTGAKIDAASTPFGRIVQEVRGTTTESLPNATLTVYPLTGNSYTQPAGRDDAYVAGLSVLIPASCTGLRSVTVGLLVDPVDPSNPKESEFVAQRVFEDESTAPLTRQISVGPAASFQPVAATSHDLSLAAKADCEGGGGVTATSGGIDVIGTK
jgi:hypothetical protein